MPYTKTQLKVPDGFSSLLENLAMEVLREQPKNIELFAAKYFTQLLKTRDETGIDPSIKEIEINKYISNDKLFHVEDSKENLELEKSALKIQSQFRGYKSRKDVLRRKKSNNAAIKIQASYRGYSTRKNMANQNLKDQTITTERATKVYNPQEDLAALKIQSNYRGYAARKNLKNRTEKENINKQEMDSIEADAAIKIQSHYKGYLTRKKIKKAYKPEINVDCEKAAIKIQSRYRGYKTRKNLKKENQQMKSFGKTKDAAILTKKDAAVKIQSNYKGYMTRKKMKTENKLLNEHYEKAAVKIQSRFRGYCVRKNRVKGEQV